MKILIVSIISLLLVINAHAQLSSRTSAAFTIGNLVIYRVGDGTSSLLNTGAPIFLDEYTPTGVLVQSIALPTSTSGANAAIIASGTASSEGLLTRSSNGQFLVATGYNSSIPASSSLSGTASATISRTIVSINNAGTVNTTTSLTDFTSANNPRSATSIDGTAFWAVGGTGGVRYATLGSTTSSSVSTTVANIRDIRIFNNQLYFSSGSGTNRLAAVGTGIPNTTGETASVLSGVSTTGSHYGFFFADLSSSVPGLDVLYIADDAVGIQKYSLVGSTWVTNGSPIGTAADAYRGLTGTVSGAIVTLYTTRKGGSAASGGGELASVVDATGYNVAPTATPVLLATAATNTAFRGVALTPTVTPLPVKLVSFNAGIEDKNVTIWWSTSNEINLKEFIVEKSNDALNFKVIGTVTASSSTSSNNYSFIDKNPTIEKVYYRLKMIDKDGSFKYSSIITVNNKLFNAISIYPNPAINEIVVTHPKIKEETKAIIYNSFGKEVVIQNVQKNSTASIFNVKQLTSGNYILVLYNKDERTSIKFIKQ
jgi:hypothetical protein